MSKMRTPPSPFFARLLPPLMLKFNFKTPHSSPPPPLPTPFTKRVNFVILKFHDKTSEVREKYFVGCHAS